jgi:hypothetical protein
VNPGPGPQVTSQTLSSGQDTEVDPAIAAGAKKLTTKAAA